MTSAVVTDLDYAVKSLAVAEQIITKFAMDDIGIVKL